MSADEKAAHTKGPWLAAARPSSFVGWPVVSPSDMGRSVCNVTTGHDQSEANARLIAAAPDLLAACQSWLEEVEGTYPFESLAPTRAAIAKASA